MNVLYETGSVSRFFSDFELMKRKLPSDWVRTIKKHLDYLTAADCFGTYFKLGYGHPEPMKPYPNRFSVHISANVRLILELDATSDPAICTTVTVKGVCDYHGNKENWYIR